MKNKTEGPDLGSRTSTTNEENSTVLLVLQTHKAEPIFLFLQVAEIFLQNLDRFVSGQPLKFVVDFESKY